MLAISELEILIDDKVLILTMEFKDVMEFIRFSESTKTDETMEICNNYPLQSVKFNVLIATLSTFTI